MLHRNNIVADLHLQLQTPVKLFGLVQPKRVEKYIVSRRFDETQKRRLPSSNCWVEKYIIAVYKKSVSVVVISVSDHRSSTFFFCRIQKIFCFCDNFRECLIVADAVYNPAHLQKLVEWEKITIREMQHFVQIIRF